MKYLFTGLFTLLLVGGLALLTAPDSNPPEDPQPTENAPFCGMSCEYNEDCSGLGVNPICTVSGTCYDAQACGDYTPEPEEDTSPFICPELRSYVDGAEPYEGCTPLVTIVETVQPEPTEGE